MSEVTPLELLLVVVIGGFWAGVIGLTAYGAATLIRSRRARETREADNDDPAVADLRRRLARGEISEPEFERLRSVLRGR